MRISLHNVCSLIQRGQLSLLRLHVSSTKTLVGRVADGQSVRAASQQVAKFRDGPGHDIAVSPPFLSRVESPKGPEEAEARLKPEPENLVQFPGARQRNGSWPLPASCPGCGALAQETHKDEAGFYTRSRKAVKLFLQGGKREALKEVRTTDQSHKRAGQYVDHVHATGDAQDVNHALAADSAEPCLSIPQKMDAPPIPICDRCHDLVYNSRGVAIVHPSIDSLADSIAESPFRQNHVYHVLDAADFPLSLIPSIYRRLSLAKPRTQNRRSQHKFSSRPTISFIITRSDLLAPTKEMVDSLMPYFQSVLRTALGRHAEDIRLGNVHLVSSKRGWWTREIKESIWKRGGGSWMVGKVNVGKSNLFEVLFPKGSTDRTPSYADLEQEVHSKTSSPGSENTSGQSDNKLELLSETSLLPPPQPETPYPVLP